MTEHAKRGLVDESARRGLTASLVDFPPIDNADGRAGGGSDGSKLNALRDERTGNENGALDDSLLLGRRLCVAVGTWAAGERSGADDHYAADSKEHLHEGKYADWLHSANIAHRRSWSAVGDGGSYDTVLRTLLLKLLRQTGVNETADGIVGEAGIILTVANFAVCHRRILIKYIVAPHSYARSFE